jgi:L-threonate 2-dehydrogenase
MSETQAQPTIGVVGLGIMGISYARNLREAGFRVIGYDVAEAALKALVDAGGERAASPQDVAARADVILLALASVNALKAVCAGETGMIHSIREGAVVVEMGTLALETKNYVRDLFEPKGVAVLDWAVAQRLRPVFDGFARNTRYVGPFGSGTKLKFVANLLVTIHNLAAAEALLLANQSGLDLNMVYEAIRDGAGNSRMFEVRGPLMIEDTYQPATMKMEVYMKDLDLISDFARDMRAPTPLMAASIPFYVAALAAGRNADDTAALYAVLKDMTAPARN